MDAQDDRAAGNAAILVDIGLVLATLLVFGLGVVLVWFAFLRESREFWTNAGGYPIWLRDLVLWSYLPLFAATGFGLTLLSMAWVSRLCRSIRFMLGEGAMLVICWGLFASSGYIAFANNVRNLIDGRDLHYHDH